MKALSKKQPRYVFDLGPQIKVARKVGFVIPLIAKKIDLQCERSVSVSSSVLVMDRSSVLPRPLLPQFDCWDWVQLPTSTLKRIYSVEDEWI